MSSLERRLNSWALSLFQALETNTQTKTRVLVVAGGVLATIGIWFVHLRYPSISQRVIDTDSRLLVLFSFGVVFAPPFAVAFSLVSCIWPRAKLPDEEESGPMSGYFYRESANKRWKLFIVAGIITALNFLLMLITSGEW